MDFKVAGTVNGITAIQMDIKIKGISEEIMHTAIEQANEGRQFILSKMLECVPEVAPELSKYAPRIISFKIDPEKIGDVVGKQGKVINSIIAETGTKIDIEDDGTVCIASYGDPESAQRSNPSCTSPKSAICSSATSCASSPRWGRSSSSHPGRTA